MLRTLDPPSERARVFQEIGLRFRLWGWISLVGLLVTGTLNLHFHGALSGTVLSSPAFWETPYGVTLARKLASVGVVLALALLHEVTGPRAGRTPGGEDGTTPDRAPSSSASLAVARWSARLLGLAAVAVVIFGVRLARGG